MKGKPRQAVNVPTDNEASDEWLTSLIRGERGGERGGARRRPPASNGQGWINLKNFYTECRNVGF